MLNTDDYRNAPSGIGPQASEWTNKPHRLIYDLCAEVERLRAALENVNRARPVDHDKGSLLQACHVMGSFAEAALTHPQSTNSAVAASASSSTDSQPQG